VDPVQKTTKKTSDMKKILFLMIFCAMLVNTISAQKIELATTKSQKVDSVLMWLNTPNLHWTLAGAKSGKNPTKQNCDPTFYLHPILKATRMEPKGVPQTSPDTVFIRDTLTLWQNIDNRSWTTVHECCDTVPSKKPILAEAHLLFYGQADLAFPTDRTFDALTPIFELGTEVHGNITEYPGLQLGFGVNAVTVPSAFIAAESCPSCVPQDPKTLFGFQAKAEVKWQVGSRFALVGFVKSRAWLPLDRKTESLPGDGWGAEVLFGKKNSAVKWHVGSAKSSERAIAPYAGLRMELGRKKSIRPIFQPTRLTRTRH
jgi:hypothetical protein